MVPATESGARAADPSRFQFTGGLLERSMYVERAADRVLAEALLEGEYCHILAPRQIGKTSLCFRVARELTKRGVRCALVDVTAAGTPSSAEEWYFGLVDEIARRLRLPDPLDAWQARPGVAPAQRFRDFVRRLVEGDPEASPLVIFLDEIEMVRLAPVDVDDFLLILRSFHEERGQSPALLKLAFCLIGVTTPNDLIKNKSVTPFNVSKPIRVDDFTRQECDALAPGLEALDADPRALLDAVYTWTDGHPYMTMRACFEIARRKQVRRGAEREAVDLVVRELFLDRPLEDTNLNYAARRFEDPRFERDGARLGDKLQLYRTVLAHGDPPAHGESAVQMELRICGMVKDVEVAPGRRVLRPRNAIYEVALNGEWLRSKGERRFFSEAVWKWLDAGKDEAALLRGVVLEKALAWARTNALSEDEQAFLDASQRQETTLLAAERSRVTADLLRAHTEQEEVAAELVMVREALARANAEKADVEAARQAFVDQRSVLQASIKKSNRLLALSLMALTVVVVWAAVVGSRTRDQQTQATAARDRWEAEMEELRANAAAQKAKADEAARRADAAEALAKQKESLAQEKDALAKKKDEELLRRKDELDHIDELKAQSKRALDESNRKVAELNRYIAQNKDLKQTADDARAKSVACEVARARLEQQLKSAAAASPPPRVVDDPYP